VRGDELVLIAHDDERQRKKGKLSQVGGIAVPIAQSVGAGNGSTLHANRGTTMM